MERVSAGKRAGSRRAEKPKRTFSRPALLHSLGITACVIAWGYLVYAAIDFGTSARAGTGSSWWLLGLATLGAVACLFTGLMLIARLLRILGMTGDPGAAGDFPSYAFDASATSSTPPAQRREPSYAAAVSGPSGDSAPPSPRRPPGHRRAGR
jgi:hypothetical protein